MLSTIADVDPKSSLARSPLEAPLSPEGRTVAQLRAEAQQIEREMAAGMLLLRSPPEAQGPGAAPRALVAAELGNHDDTQPREARHSVSQRAAQFEVAALLAETAARPPERIQPTRPVVYVPADDPTRAPGFVRASAARPQQHATMSPARSRSPRALGARSGDRAAAPPGAAEDCPELVAPHWAADADDVPELLAPAWCAFLHPCIPSQITHTSVTAR